MRLRTLLGITLLGLLLWASSAGAEDTQSGEDTSEETGEELGKDEADKDEEEAPKKEKTTEIEEDNDVMVLHINNFERALSENKYLLVEFYAPWCGHCKQLEPIYAEAAGKLKQEDTSMRLAKVDAVEEKELAEEFEIGSFPTIKLFVNGDRKETILFNGGRSAEGIVQWMRRRSSPGAPALDSPASAADFINKHNITVVGFFEDLESEAAKLVDELYFEMTDVEFAKTSSPEVFQKYEVKADSVVLFKKFDDGRADLPVTEESPLDKGKLTTFIKDNSLELITKFTLEKAQSIFTSSVKIHTLMFINSSVDGQVAVVEDSRSVARDFKGKMLFIVIDVVDTLTHVLKYFGVSDSDTPTVRIINMSSRQKYSLPPEAFSAASLRQICQEVMDGTAKPYFLSEEIPEDWDKGPVKVLVGKNFNSVVQDPTKNVFVKFYLPKCQYCKEIAPIWEQLGEKYADHPDIIIAEFNSEANEAEGLDVGLFPTLKFFPAEGKEALDYTGDRTVEKMSEFLDSGGVLPEKDMEEDDDDEEEVVDEKDKDEGKEAVESPEVSTNATAKDEL